MNKIPTVLTQEQFGKYVGPHPGKAKRGFVCKIPLFGVSDYILFTLYTGCQWKMLPIREFPSGEPEISRKTVWYHFRKRCRDGSLRKAWHASTDDIGEFPGLGEISSDGTHATAKKGGESVGWQGRKKAKTSNILVIIDKNGNPPAPTEIISGNHNDACDPGSNLRDIFGDMKKRDLTI